MPDEAPDQPTRIGIPELDSIHIYIGVPGRWARVADCRQKAVPTRRKGKPLDNGIIHVSVMKKRSYRPPARDIEEVKFATMIAGSQSFSIG